MIYNIGNEKIISNDIKNKLVIFRIIRVYNFSQELDDRRFSVLLRLFP